MDGLPKRLVGTSFLLAPSAYRNEVRNARHYTACSIRSPAGAETDDVATKRRIVVAPVGTTQVVP